MNKLAHEKALLRQQIDAQRTLMRLEVAIIRADAEERFGRVRKAFTIGKQTGGVLATAMSALKMLNALRRPEAAKPASPWRRALKLLAFASPLLGVVRFIVKQRQARRAGA